MSACVLAVALACMAAAANGDELEETREELEQVTERLNALREWFSRAERQERRWQREIQATDTRIAETRNELRRIEARRAELEEEIAGLEATREALEQRRAEQAERIAEHIGAAHRIAGEDFFKLLLNREDPSELERMARYHRHFSQARLDALAAFRATLAELEGNRRERQRRRQALERQSEQLGTQRSELEARRSERETLLAELAEEAEDREREQQRLREDRERLQELMSELRRREPLPDGGEFVARRGTLPWPVEGTLERRFGQERSGGRLQWQGIFIAADEGASVRAVHPGRVAFADWLRGFGLMAIIDHGGGHMSLYAHAEALFKEVGEWVEAGETIATAGASGGQEQSGVYFEIRVEGSPTDPGDWLDGR